MPHVGGPRRGGPKQGRRGKASRPPHRSLYLREGSDASVDDSNCDRTAMPTSLVHASPRTQVCLEVPFGPFLNHVRG